MHTAHQDLPAICSLGALTKNARIASSRQVLRYKIRLLCRSFGFAQTIHIYLNGPFFTLTRNFTDCKQTLQQLQTTVLKHQ